MKHAVRILTVWLLLAVMSLSFCSCSADNTPPVMTYGSTQVTKAMYTYWMSAYKGYFLNTVLGIADTPEALSTEMQIEENGVSVTKTVGEILNARINEIIENNCISLALFDSYGLKVTDELKSTVNIAISSEIENAGSRRALNEALAPLGLNADLLEDMFLAEEKVNYLYEYLYGSTQYGTTGAEPISVERYDQFYQDNYVCVKHIYIRTLDKNVTDENGAATYDENGNLITAELTAEEQAERMAQIDAIMEQLHAGADFDALMQEYSMDANRAEFPEGYIVCRSTQMPAEFLDAAFDMEIGELRRVDASYATHIMLRTELPDAGWKIEKYQSMMDGFTDRLKSEVYAEKIAPMRAEIEKDEELLAALTIENIPLCTY